MQQSNQKQVPAFTRRICKPAASLTLIGAALLFGSGCMTRTLQVTNVKTDSALAPPTRSGALIPSLQNDDKLTITLKEFSFSNGRGHEFEDAVQYEVYRNFITSREYLRGWLQKVVEWIALEPVGNLLSGKDREKLEDEVVEEFAEALARVEEKYLEPQYTLVLTITPLALLPDSQKAEPESYAFPLAPTPTLVGFRENTQAEQDWETQGSGSGLLSAPLIHSVSDLGAKMDGYMAFDFSDPDRCRELFEKPFENNDAAQHFGKYNWQDATHAAVTFPYIAIREIIRTPFMVLVPYKWDALTSLDRFALPQRRHDPMTRAIFCCRGALSERPIAVLDRLQRVNARIELQLVRKSHLNERLDQLKKKIAEISVAESALGAKYGSPGKRVGRTVDSQLKAAALKQVKEKYYTEEIIFSGECFIGKQSGAPSIITFEGDDGNATKKSQRPLGTMVPSYHRNTLKCVLELSKTP